MFNEKIFSSGHRYAWTVFTANSNQNDFSSSNGDWQESAWAAFVNVYPVSIDCFFVLGGCLLSFSILVALERLVN
jgi:hypothetical protein